VTRLHLTISHKFFAVLAVLAPLILAVALAGVVGLGSMKVEFDRVFADNIHTSQVSTRLGADFARAGEIALRLAAPTDPGERRRLFTTLDRSVSPSVEIRLSQLEALHAHDHSAERAQVNRLARGWGQFMALRDAGALNQLGANANGRDRLSDRLIAIFDPLSVITQREAALEADQAGDAYARAVKTYHDSRLVIWSIAIAACVLGIGSMLLLARNVVPRIRRYSLFAAAVASGDLSVRIASRGSDELATLGRTLDEMVERREFVDSLQVTDSEAVAHDLLKRQVQRLVPDSSAVVLNRNNSDDRLEATTTVSDDSPLKVSLTDAKPRSCMAVRFARSYSEDPDRDPLTHCEICGQAGGRATCEPLLVGGEVIGSVLVQHEYPLGEQQTAALRDSVSQAAPIIANLRGLALAQFRASTDGLTALPNQRAVKDTVRRMVAQTSRTLAPLSAIMFDLDHFKQINDSYGHSRGDDVLAAVGAALAETVRASDFVGRNGGEEFIVLLPNTDTDEAVVVAEKIRVAISEIAVTGVDRPITASLGVATIPHHATDGEQLVRTADRALYLAKNNGRNRVEVGTGTPSPAESAALTA
jgi:diguanylate cyclase (GGDEF)-like protein